MTLRHGCVALLCGCGLAAAAAAPAPAVAQAPLPPAASPAAARLAGPFALTGRVTVATNVPGEHAGQRVQRRWTFTPLCPAGACRRVALLRTRASGEDQLILHATAPGAYAGNGSFTAPLRCGRQTYGEGERVPFKITVRVTEAAVLGGVAIATRVRATYTNTSRINLTRCVGVLGHDAATYQGQLVPRAAPAAVDLRAPSAADRLREVELVVRVDRAL